MTVTGQLAITCYNARDLFYSNNGACSLPCDGAWSTSGKSHNVITERSVYSILLPYKLFPEFIFPDITFPGYAVPVLGVMPSITPSPKRHLAQHTQIKHHRTQTTTNTHTVLRQTT
jgi:hypothetical protein